MAILAGCLGAVVGAEPTAPNGDDLHRIVTQDAETLKSLLGHREVRLPLVSAHRGGAAAGYPENCIATFEHTLTHTYSLLEVDPRYTKDGEIVLHHDETLERTTTGRGPLKERTLAELRQLRLKDLHGAVTDERMPTLDEAIEWARGKTVLVLDQKTVPVEQAIQKMEEHRAEGWTMLIVSHAAVAKRVHHLNPDIMMEMIISNRKQFEAFEATGVPWENIVAFVGHKADLDEEVIELLREKGVRVMAGTSRHLDLELAGEPDDRHGAFRERYRAVLEKGVDLIETDVPVEVGRLLYEDAEVPASVEKILVGPDQ